jgi:hypothetical protein
MGTPSKWFRFASNSLQFPTRTTTTAELTPVVGVAYPFANIHPTDVGYAIAFHISPQRAPSRHTVHA